MGGGAGKYGDRGQILGVSSEEEVGGLSCSPRQVSDTTVVEVGEVGKGCSLLSVIQQYRIETCHSIHHSVREAEGERREQGRNSWNNSNILIIIVTFHNIHVHVHVHSMYLNRLFSLSVR